MFPESDKFYIVIIEIYFSFSESLLVVFYEVQNPISSIRTAHRIWRISNDNHYRFICFHLISILPLSCDTLSESEECTLSFTITLCFFERVGEVDLETLVEFGDACFCERESEFEMCDSVARHHQLKSVESWNKVILDI